MTASPMFGVAWQNPLWWRIPAWAAIVAASVVQAHGTTARIATGVLIGVAALALQFITSASAALRVVSLLVTTVAGLAACLAAPQGFAEIPVLVATSRAPLALDGRALRWFVVLDTIAFGATVGWIARSLPSLIAGTAVPLLVQRAVEHRDLVRERDRAQALLVEAQHAREAEAQAAALQERGRIAREMHDVLAHTLAGLSLHLQGARAVAAREQVPPSVLGPLDQAAALAREGLHEAREAVGALGDPVGLGLDALPALVARHPGTAALAVQGTPATVAPDAGHAVYRAVQESLTNAARYAPGAPVTVTLDWRADTLAVTVGDPGAAPGRRPVTDAGTGLGLAGMAERLGQVGGRVQAGPAAGGGWRVELSVPATVPTTALAP